MIWTHQAVIAVEGVVVEDDRMLADNSVTWVNYVPVKRAFRFDKFSGVLVGGEILGWADDFRREGHWIVGTVHLNQSIDPDETGVCPSFDDIHVDARPGVSLFIRARLREIVLKPLDQALWPEARLS